MLHFGKFTPLLLAMFENIVIVASYLLYFSDTDTILYHGEFFDQNRYSFYSRINPVNYGTMAYSLFALDKIPKLSSI